MTTRNLSGVEKAIALVEAIYCRRTVGVWGNWHGPETSPSSKGTMVEPMRGPFTKTKFNNEDLQLQGQIENEF